MIQLTHAQVSWTDYGCVSRFEDGSEAPAAAHPDMPHYHVISHRTGCGDDLLLYVRSHELCHHLVAQWLFDTPSQVLWGVAHGKMLSGPGAAYEEAFAQVLGRFIFANERPILSGLPKLDEWKAEALAMIEAENAAWAATSLER